MFALGLENNRIVIAHLETHPEEDKNHLLFTWGNGEKILSHVILKKKALSQLILSEGKMILTL